MSRDKGLGVRVLQGSRLGLRGSGAVRGFRV